jgi:serine protease Do
MAASMGVTTAALPLAQDGAAPKEKPRSEEKTIRRQLNVFGSREAQIGVSVRDLDPDQARTAAGAVVDHVAPDSPAERAGVKAGDVITSFDGEKVRSAKQLARLVNETAPGRIVATTVLRDGKPVDLKVTPEAGDMARFDGEFAFPPMADLERLPEMNLDGRMFRFDEPGSTELFEKRMPGGEGRGFRFFGNPGRGRLGVGLQQLTPQLAEYFGAKDGVLVTTVEQDSPAGRAGLKAGDVITSVNGTAVDSAADVMQAMRDMGDGSELTITYMRDRKTATARAKLEPREERQPPRSGRPI